MHNFQNKNHRKPVTMILQFSSVADKDLNASIDLTHQFINAFRQWLLSRRFKSPMCSNFAFALPSILEVRKVQQTSRFTVIRSAFVYKKTREQFGLNKKTWYFHLKLNNAQREIFLQYLTQLKLPAELSVHCQ